MSVLNAKNAKTYVNFGDIKSLELFKSIDDPDGRSVGRFNSLLMHLTGGPETAMKSDGTLFLLGINLNLLKPEEKEKHVINNLVKFVKKNPDDLFFISEEALEGSKEDALAD